MISMFKDSPATLAHADFQRWRQANPDGFFANQKTKSEILIHAVLCTHPGDTEWQCEDDGFHSLTKKLKICSNDLRSILNWAAQNNVSIVKRCGTCNPN